MTNIQKALCWGGAILLNAIGNVYGLIDDTTAQTLFIVLPIFAVWALKGGTCRLVRRGA